jgi:hypothetical protein
MTHVKSSGRAATTALCAVAVVGAIIVIVFVGFLVLSETRVLRPKEAPSLTGVRLVERLIERPSGTNPDSQVLREQSKKLGDISNTLANANAATLAAASTDLTAIHDSLIKLAEADEKQSDKLRQAVDQLKQDSDQVAQFWRLPSESWEWKATLLSSLMWFLILGAISVSLFVYPNVVGMIGFAVGFLRSFKGLGFELSFSDEGRKRNEEIRTRFSNTFEDLRSQAKTALQLFVDQHDIACELENAATAIIGLIDQKRGHTVGGQPNPLPLVVGQGPLQLGIAPQDWRCTVHVPDLIFAEHLCQLVDYYPQRSKSNGRAWPVFYGIIGRAWRSRYSEIQSFRPAAGDVGQILVDEYAMTRQQAHDLHRRRLSFLCVVLRHQQTVVGVLYMDAVNEDAFGPPVRGQGVEFRELESACQQLSNRLAGFREHLLGNAPLIQVFGT